MKPNITAAIPALVLAVGLAFSPALASAQTETEAEDANAVAERQAAATELVAVSQVGAMVDQLTFLFTNDILPMLVRHNPGKDELLEEIVKEEVSGAASDIAPHMISFMSEIWARHFTLEEIQSLTAFYRTPAGKKLLKMQPIIAQESNKAGVELSKQASYYAMSRLRERMKAEELVIPDRL